ncbi:MAG: cadherin-like domain-containing protein, partial [Desulfotignum sp.]|nr:cadherin-like domain-containing protein [Desulfotignum sp.]
EDTPVVIDVLANDTDADGDSLAVDSVTQGAYGEVSITSGGSDVTYTPDPDYNGEDSFTYIVSDGNGGTAEATVYVMVEETDEEIWGTDGDDTLYGLSGDDTIYGLGGDDRLYGDDPDDQNVEGNDVLYGGSGDDTLEGGPGSDQLDGGDETLIDIATYQNDPQGIFVTMGSPVSVQDGWGGTDTLTDIEYIRGSDSGDSFSGDGRDMVYEGGGGNDTIDGGTQEYDGGATVSYWNDPVNPGDPGISVDLNDVNEDGYVWVTDGYSDTDRLKHITGVVGSAGNDTLTGVDNEFNFFMGLQGDDFIDGGAFSGNDPDNSAGYLKDPAAIVAHVYYNLTKSNPFEGSYVEDGWGYTDTLVNITGIEGSAYDDQITFDIYDPDNTSDIWWDVWGMAGADTITGTSGENVTASYEDDPSGVNVDLSTGTAVDGWGDTDTLIDIQGVDGSEFNDTIKGNSFDNYLEGEEGDDLIEGIGGDNFLEGGPGNDTLTGGAGSDFFEPGTGNDSVSGGGDWDHVSYSWIDDETFNGVTIDLASGTATGRDSYGDLLFTDTLAGIEGATGSEYDDNITGNMEDNYFGGTEGNDSLDGGDGWDHVSYEWIDSDSFYGIDIDLASGTATGRDSYGDLLFTDTLTSIEGITGSEYDDTIQGGSPTEYLSGGHGNDQITGGEGDEFLDGGAGNDTLTGGPGWDMLQGGDGSDTFVFTHSQSTDTIEDFQVTSDVIRFQETELGFSADGGYAFYTASSEDQHSPLDKQIMGVTDTVSDWADAADALNNVLNGYGSGDDDDTYFVLSNGTDARVYYWDGDADSSGTLDDSELVHLADLNGVTDGDIGSMTASNFEIDQTPV